MEPGKLASWKEIASYLNVDIKTAQRWERLRGLPVHRIPGGRRASVYALTAEVEEWLRSADAQADEPEIGQVGEPPPPSLVTNRTLWLVLLSILMLSAALLVARRSNGGNIASAEVRGQFLTALDMTGNTLWTAELGPTARPPQPRDGWREALRTVRWRPGDNPELVAAIVEETQSGQESHVLCLDDDGQKRWQWDVAFPLLDFNGQPFEPIWDIQQVLLDATGPESIVWVPIANPIRWASGLFRLDSTGQPRLQFANAGSIQRVLRLSPAEGSKLLVAGVNNAWSRPFIAEIDPDGPTAFSPPSGNDRYRYADTPKGLPRSYYLLPDSEIHRAGNIGYFHVGRLHRIKDKVLLDVIGGPESHSVFTYEFDLELTPVRVRTTATGVGAHQYYEAKGEITHPVSKCPEMTGSQVLRKWTAAEGWKEIPVRVASAGNLQ